MARSKTAQALTAAQPQEEIYKPIPQARTLYEASNLGNVRSITTGKLVKPYIKTKNGVPTGRLYVRLSIEGIRHSYSVARLVLLAHFGPPRTRRHEASHKDDCPGNNRLDNLIWETRKKNLQRRKTDSIKGSTNGNAKLGTDIAYLIYCAYHRKEASIRKLAKRWCVGAMTVSDLVNGKTWSTFGFAEQLAQGNERYIDPNASQVATVSSGNPFLDAFADMTDTIDTDDTNTTETTTTDAQQDAQPIIVNWFLINGEEMAQLADEDEAEDTDALIPAASIIDATATPTTSKPRRLYRF